MFFSNYWKPQKTQLNNKREPGDTATCVKEEKIDNAEKYVLSVINLYVYNTQHLK